MAIDMKEVAFDTEQPWGQWRPIRLHRCLLRLIDALPRGRLFRRLAFLLRRPVKRGEQRLIDHTVWGLRLRFLISGNLTEQRWLMIPKFHDAMEREILAERLGPEDVFLDVGANAGFYSFWALSLGIDGLRIVAVEPNRRMLQRIGFNLTTNGGEKAVQLIDSAVSAKPGEVFIEEHGENLGQTRVTASGSGYAVPARTLWQIMQEAGIDRSPVLKIDIEGGESAVMSAFFREAPRSVWPRLITGEIVGEDGVEFRKLLEARGYRMERRSKMNGIFVLDCADGPAKKGSR